MGGGWRQIVESPDPEPGQLHFRSVLYTELLCKVSFEKAKCATRNINNVANNKKDLKSNSQMPKFHK